ncbi:MAG: TrkH family potassium uptake protein [Clostridia bacterium]|nr:TrkH family potassium uptake protein [Clostridia bacterium]
MNFSVILYVVGAVLRVEGALLLLPGFVGLIYRERAAWAFFAVAAVSFLTGAALCFRRKKRGQLFAKEGFVAVALSWLMISLFGCAPFVINRDIPNFVNAFFETVSGFTTTGSSILRDIEALSHASLFWRSFTHWIGGMGVLVFLLMMLPAVGGSGLYLMKAESPGPQVGKTVPKLRQNAFVLYLIYTAMTVAEILILLCGKMPLFDAVTAAFGTAGTGGFAVKNTSIASYSPFCQYTITVFMILFGMNFNAYYFILMRRVRQAARIEELRWYLGIIAVSVLAIFINTRHIFDSAEQTFRSAFFHVGSIITTTGFAIRDYNDYPQFSKVILLLLMFIGACAGSTGGGMKVSRIAVMIKSAVGELSCVIHPRIVKRVRLDGKVIENDTLRSINTFLISYIGIFIVSLLIVSVDDFGMMTNFSAVAATINNIGPGFDIVGPAGNYASFSDLSKLVFCFDMLAGRLEVIPMLVLISPVTWSRAIRLRRRVGNGR